MGTLYILLKLAMISNWLHYKGSGVEGVFERIIFGIYLHVHVYVYALRMCMWTHVWFDVTSMKREQLTLWMLEIRAKSIKLKFSYNVIDWDCDLLSHSTPHKLKIPKCVIPQLHAVMGWPVINPLRCFI